MRYLAFGQIWFVAGVVTCALFGEVAAAGETSRHTTTGKTIIVNDDGYSAFHTGDYKTPADVRNRILAYRDTQVGVVEWCFLSGSRVNYRSQVTELIGDGVARFPRRGDQQACETLRAIADSGVDLTKVVADACHEAGLRCYASMRMNGDYSAGWMGESLPRLLNSRFWWEHPEYRVRGLQGQDLTKLSYAVPAVCDFKLRLVREIAARDIDGINLDFLRHPPFFGYEEPLVKAFQQQFHEDPHALKIDDPRWVQFRCDIMTGFVRDVRAILDDAGKRKGRRIGLSARVDWRRYRAAGLDVERWLKDGLLNYLVVAQRSLGGYEFDLRPFAKMAQGTGCAVYFGEEALRSGHDLTPQEDKLIGQGKLQPPQRSRLTVDQYRARAAKWYAAGADGIHLFNENNLTVLCELGGVEGAR